MQAFIDWKGDALQRHAARSHPGQGWRTVPSGLAQESHLLARQNQLSSIGGGAAEGLDVRFASRLDVGGINARYERQTDSRVVLLVLVEKSV